MLDTTAGLEGLRNQKSGMCQLQDGRRNQLKLCWICSKI